MRVHRFGNHEVEVDFSDGTRVLFSYSTPVAAYVPGTGYVRTKSFHSQTTARHVGRWLGGGAALSWDQEFLRKLVEER